MKFIEVSGCRPKTRTTTLGSIGTGKPLRNAAFLNCVRLIVQRLPQPCTRDLLGDGSFTETYRIYNCECFSLSLLLTKRISIFFLEPVSPG